MADSQQLLLLSHATLVDATAPEPRADLDVLIEGNRIKDIDRRIKAGGTTTVIDLKGLTLMPGLIDAHVHVCAPTLDIGAMRDMSESYIAAYAAHSMKDMLMRGFTTVRDAGGADAGLKYAQAEGLLLGPRLFVSGKGLSQTGGHGDFRPRGAMACFCCAAQVSGMDRIADGADAVRHAARDEFRRGADQLKIMAGGGVASPSDPLHNTQYSMEEMRAAVEEAEAWNTYVAAHAYTPRSIRRAVEAGIRSIEHGNLLDEPTAKVMAERGAYLIPTNVTYRALHRDGKALGLPSVSIAKLKEVLTAGLEAVAIAKKCGVKIGHGSDLLGQQQCHQSEEFLIKGEVLTPYEVLTAATKTNAELLGRSHDLGILTPGALADLLIVDGNPLANLSVLAYPERHLRAILQNGRFVKNL